MDCIDHKDRFTCDYSMDHAVKRYVFAFLSLFILLCLAYGSSFQGTWVFDDHHDILQNKIISSFSWPDFFRAYIGDHFSRPIPILSFFLNYRIGGYDIYGYHIVNFTIHYIAALFVFLFVYKTMLLPSLAAKYREYAYSSALLTAAFWCTSPLHVTAVTFITQRYTSLAGMFYFMSMFFFVQGRTARKKSSTILYYVFCGVTAVMSFLSKENAAMLPVSLYFYDLLLIRGANRENVLKDMKRMIWPLTGLLLVGIFYLTTTGFPLDYKVYSFTMKERLLTEPRIILFYLSLLLYPVPTRLTFDHDYMLSTSLFTPWTTSVAIFLIIGVIGYALIVMKGKPLIAFCILFFFLNHVIESSIIPIEIIWEYRNYVPSLSFFILLVLFLLWTLQFFRNKKMIFYMISGCMIVLIVAQVDTVYRRNTLFYSEKMLWRDSALKSPGLSRPYTNLALLYFQEGNIKKALQEARKAVALNKHPNDLASATMYTNLATYQMMVNDLEEALKNIRRALSLQPCYDYGHAATANLMMKKGDLESASAYITQAIFLSPDKDVFHSRYALILFHQGKSQDALKEAHRALTINAHVSEPKMIIAEIMRQKKLYGKAIAYWNDYLQNVPNDRRAILALIELYSLINKRDLAQGMLNYLLTLENGNLQNLLSQKNTYDHVYKIEGKRLKPIIKTLLQEMGECCN